MLTAKQQETYKFIRKYICQNDIAPTESEIAIGIGITSRGVVHRYVTALANAGYIEIIPNKRRNIRLVDSGDGDTGNSTSLPIIGKIAAGQPIEAIENQEDFNFSEKLLGPNRYILEVKGDSMIGDNICDGDYIICERRDVANKGDIVVALVEQQDATLKRIKNNSDGTVSLIPSNPVMESMTYPADSVRVQGVYLALMRLV